MVAPRRNILLIDDDTAFLETVERAFRLISESNVVLAQSPAQAVEVLENTRIDLAVIDIRMPVIDGVQFLHLLQRKYPGIRKIVLTGYAEPAYRKACLEGGAEMFLEKPRTQEEFDIVLAAIDALLRIAPVDGFHGVLRRVDLHEILQLECLSRRSSILEIVGARVRGRVYIKDGLILHADTGAQTGRDAFYALSALRSGEFAVVPYVEPEEITIGGEWEFLLMEASRLRDEAGLAESSESGPIYPSLISNVEIEPFSRPEADHARDSSAQDKKSDAVLEGGSPTRTLAVNGTEQHEDGASDAVQVEEVVLCDGAGNIQQLVHSHDPNLRITLMDFVRSKQSQLSKGLPFGAFVRMEAKTPREMAVVVLEENSGLFVRGVSSGWEGEQLIAQAQEHFQEVLSYFQEALS